MPITTNDPLRHEGDKTLAEIHSLIDRLTAEGKQFGGTRVKMALLKEAAAVLAHRFPR